MADPKARTHFGPVVLTGLGAAALLAVVSARDWFHLGGARADLAVPDSELGADMPLALALALLVLASWGVVLVTRARARRLVLACAAVAAAGVAVCLVVAPFSLPDQIRAGLALAGGRKAEPTAAYVVACVAVLLSLAAAVVGWRLAPRWPTMSSRYDAPATRSAGSPETELWRALDEGRDPTEAEGPSSP